MIAIANTRIALQPTKSSLTSRSSIASPPKERGDPFHSSFPRLSQWLPRQKVVD
jgi:hypothetical protein